MLLKAPMIERVVLILVVAEGIYRCSDILTVLVVDIIQPRLCVRRESTWERCLDIVFYIRSWIMNDDLDSFVRVRQMQGCE